MSRGRRSPFRTPDVLEKLRIGRNGATAVMAGSRPTSDRYSKALALSEAIDDLTEDLSGDREMFWTKPHG